MTEIEYRADHAQWCHQHLLKEGIDCHWQWQECIGLWETSIWTYGRTNDRTYYGDSIITYKLMKNLNPGQRGD